MSAGSAQPTPIRPQHEHMLSPPSPRRPSKAPGQGLVVLVLGALFVLLLVALVALSARLYSSNWVMPSVEALGIPLGGRSRAEAVALLRQQWGQRTILLRDGDRSWLARVSELGLILDAETTVGIALKEGRAWTHLRSLWQGGEPLRVPLVVVVDRAAAERYLVALAPQLAVSPVDAGLRVVNGRAEAVPPAEGRVLDVATTTSWLVANSERAVATGQIPLVFLAVPPVLTDVSSLVEQANAWLSNPLSIHAYDPITDESLWWSASPEVWAAWLSASMGKDPGTLDWTLDSAQLRAYLESQAETLAPQRYVELDVAVDAVESAIASGYWDVFLRVYHRPQEHVVQFGETLASIARKYGFPYPWLQQANPSVDALRPGQRIAIPSPDIMLPLPIVAHKRIVISISRQAMWAYEWGEVKWVWAVSTGIESSPTSPGVFQVQSHDVNAYAASWDLWMPYFIGIYRPVPTSNFMNGFHGFPTRDGTSLLWTGNLGYPVTFGCILVSTGNAAALYEWAEKGVIVEIQP